MKIEKLDGIFPLFPADTADCPVTGQEQVLNPVMLVNCSVNRTVQDLTVLSGEGA